MSTASVHQTPRSRKTTGYQPMTGPQTTVPCPKCPAQVRYTPSQRFVFCPGCGWQVSLSEQEGHDFLWGVTGIDPTLDLGQMLRVIATRCAPVAEPPPAVFSAGGPGVLKQRVAPAADETPRQRAERLAEQYSLNGGRLRFADGGVYATSQQRRESDLAPLTEYTIRRPNGRDFECNCRHTGLCAHLAAYWAHLDTKLSDPDQRAALSTRDYERVWLTRSHLELQFGIAARGQNPTEGNPIPPPPPTERPRATVVDLTTELYGAA